MSEAQLTTFLFNNLQKGGFKKLTKCKSKKDVRINREVGNSSYVADICISIKNNIHHQEKFSNHQVTFVAIEVKISDWQGGLYQAWRYNNFANKSFLAIYKPFCEKVDKTEFVKNNIGLIIFDEKGFSVVHQPEDNTFQENTYKAGVREKIWNRLMNA